MAVCVCGKARMAHPPIQDGDRAPKNGKPEYILAKSAVNDLYSGGAGFLSYCPVTEDPQPHGDFVGQIANPSYRQRIGNPSYDTRDPFFVPG